MSCGRAMACRPERPDGGGRFGRAGACTGEVSEFVKSRAAELASHIFAGEIPTEQNQSLTRAKRKRGKTPGSSPNGGVRTRKEVSVFKRIPEAPIPEA